jgi:hypothetical protein
LDIDLNGMGSVNALGIKARKAVVDLDGMGSVNLNVSDELDVQLDGMGSVNYTGDPKVTSDIDGMGSVKRNEILLSW